MVHIPENIDSKYRFVLLASMRAEQIVEGAPAKETTLATKPTRAGISEISEELIEWGYGPKEDPTEAAEDLGESEMEAEPAEVAES